MDNIDFEKEKAKKKMCLLGAHFSISGGLHNALYEAASLNCTALQMFTKNATRWKEKTVTPDEIELFEQAINKTGIKMIASHTSYLINLAATEKKKHAMSCEALRQELIRSSMLGIPYVVLHPGSHMGKGEKEGIKKIADSINEIFDTTFDAHTRLLLETTAGQGTSIGHTYEQIADIFDMIEQKEMAGVCFDTCHIFAAGYDIRTKESYNKTMTDFDSIIGFENLYLIHLNDSKKGLGAGVDRHEHIGQGQIGIKAFEFIMNDVRFSGIPKIIETPKGKGEKGWDKINLKMLMSLIENFN